MYPTLTDFPSTWDYVSTATLTQISVFLPRILAALVIFVVGVALARVLKRVIVHVMEAITLSKMVQHTPVEHFLQNAELNQKAEEVVGSIVYWLFMLVILQTVVSILGLESISNVLDRVLGYIPQVLSAILVLFVGMLLAGVVESLVKGSIKTIDGRSARLLGKISSYLVVAISVLAAISELGIARDFIMVLFIGFVSTMALGTGLALGLGGQDVVRKILGSWYERTRKELKD